MRQIISINLFMLLFGSSLFAQNSIIELNSLNIQNGGKNILFRVKNITQEEFNVLYFKAKDNKTFLIADLKGYSANDKIGTIYLASETNKSMNDLQNLFLFLGLNTISFDGETISVNNLSDKSIKEIERRSTINNQEK